MLWLLPSPLSCASRPFWVTALPARLPLRLRTPSRGRTLSNRLPRPMRRGSRMTRPARTPLRASRRAIVRMRLARVLRTTTSLTQTLPTTPPPPTRTLLATRMPLTWSRATGRTMPARSRYPPRALPLTSAWESLLEQAPSRKFLCSCLPRSTSSVFSTRRCLKATPLPSIFPPGSHSTSIRPSSRTMMASSALPSTAWTLRAIPRASALGMHSSLPLSLLWPLLLRMTSRPMPTFPLRLKSPLPSMPMYCSIPRSSKTRSQRLTGRYNRRRPRACVLASSLFPRAPMLRSFLGLIGPMLPQRLSSMWRAPPRIRFLR